MDHTATAVGRSRIKHSGNKCFPNTRNGLTWRPENQSLGEPAWVGFSELRLVGPKFGWNLSSMNSCSPQMQLLRVARNSAQRVSRRNPRSAAQRNRTGDEGRAAYKGRLVSQSTCTAQSSAALGRPSLFLETKKAFKS